MTTRTNRLAATIMVVFGALLLVTTDAAARQTRPALTRDVDNPALAPVRITINVNAAAAESSKQVNSITVPAGKRLVIENASVWGLTTGGDRITGVWLSPTNGTTFHLLDPNSTEFRALDPNTELIAYNRVVKGYFDAGETLQGWVFSNGTSGTKLLNIYLQGYFVNVP